MEGIKDWMLEEFLIFIVLRLKINFPQTPSPPPPPLLPSPRPHCPLHFLHCHIQNRRRPVQNVFRSVGGRLWVTSAALSSLSGSESSHTAQIQSSTFKDQSLVGLLQKSGPPDQALCWATPSSSILPILLCHLLHSLPSQGQELEQSKEVGIHLTSSL